MRSVARFLPLLFSLAVLSACDEPQPGDRWGACDETLYPGWGCVGSLGEGDACLRPVSDQDLSICVPQTWDPSVADDCSNMAAPFGLETRLQGSAYCVPDCETDEDCGPGLACSPTSHFCAWIGE